MQVMGTVAREHGFNKDFPLLCKPPEGLKYGCLHLKKFLRKYNSLSKALESYNAGKPGTSAGRRYAEDVLDRAIKYM
jgi:soluble lytic murein transglycosylase-like protein